MGKFKFRLATLLRLRERARDERREQLAQAYEADAILQEQQDRLAQDVEDLGRTSRAACGPGPLDLERLLEVRRYEVVLKAQQQALAEKRRLLEEEIARRREVLVEANRQVRVLELLRERQLSRHRQEEYREEIKLLDEVAGRRIVEEDRL